MATEQHESARAKQIKAELTIYTKFNQLEGRRNRAITHAIVSKNEYYDELRTKLIESTDPKFVETLVREGDADHAAYLVRVQERAEAAAKQPALPGTETSEEVADADLVTE